MAIRCAAHLVIAALALSCHHDPASSLASPPPPPPPPPPPASIQGVWDWRETTPTGCQTIGSYRFEQHDSLFDGSFGQAGNDCSGFADDVRGNVSAGTINGSHITFRVSASGFSCDYVGDVSGSPPSGIAGTFLCGQGTWQAHPGAPVGSVTIDSSSRRVVVGWALPLRAVLRSAAGDRLFERPVTWESDNQAVATVANTGLVTGTSAGSAMITATSDPVSARVSVTALPITSLPVTLEFAGRLDVMTADGLDRTLLTRPGIFEPAWSPDGSTLVLTAMSPLASGWWDLCAIYLVRGDDGSHASILTSSGECDHSAAWSPDGTKIAFGRGDPACFWSCSIAIWVANVDGSSQVQLAGSGSGWDTRPTWSPDGTKLAFESYDWSSDHYDIYVMNADGSGAVNLTNDPGFNNDPAWSRDGVIAFVRGGDIWTMNGDGSAATNLTANLGFESNPTWSPDGSRILFISSPDNSCYYPDPPCRHSGSDLYVMNRDGSGVQRLTETEQYEANPAWAPPTAAGSTVVVRRRSETLELSADALDFRSQPWLGIAAQRQVPPVCAHGRGCVPK